MNKQNDRISSENYFHVLPQNLNCAQAVLKGFQNEFQISENEIEEYRAWGGGRAEGGVCGALFAAERLLCHANKPSIHEEFLAVTKDIRCLEIKKGKFPCLDCVRLADELVEMRLK